MCRAGGPYCYKGATKRLEKALEEFREDPDSAEKRDNAAKMQLEYNGTRPRQKVLAQGIEDAQERGDLETAERLEGIKEKAAAHRKQQLADYKKREAAKKAQKEGENTSPQKKKTKKRPATENELQAINNLVKMSNQSGDESKDLEIQKRKEIERAEDLQNDMLPSSEMTLAEKKDWRQAIAAREAELLEEDRQDDEHDLVQEMNEWRDEHAITRALPPLDDEKAYAPITVFNTEIPTDGTMAPYKASNAFYRAYKGMTEDNHIVEVSFEGKPFLPRDGSITASVTVYKKQGAFSRFFGAKDKAKESSKLYTFKMKAKDPGDYQNRTSTVTTFDMSEVSAGSLRDLHTALKAQNQAEERLRAARGLERKVHINDPVRPMVEAERHNRQETYDLTVDETSDIFYRINEEIQDNREKKIMKRLEEYDNYLKA